MADNPQLELAFNYAQYTNRNIFLTGKAGTGKTTFLRNLQKKTHKRMIIVAPTGVAAINAGGVTIHSFFQLAPGMFVPSHLVPCAASVVRGGDSPSGKKNPQYKFTFSKHKVNILRALDLLVIDEISMVRCDLLDAIDEVLRRYQDRNKPFGGVQLLMIGDLQQLAPVAGDDEWSTLKQWYKTPYFFSSIALGQSNYTTIELNKVYRQADATFIDVLNCVRNGQMTAQVLQVLNSRFQPHFKPKEEEGYITLTTHNFQAHDINTMRLTQLATQPQSYKAQVEGEFPELSYPTDADLVLKIGAQVMFCKNDPNSAKRFYNGKIGHVVKCDAERVWVDCPDDDETIEVTPLEWTNAKYKTDEKTGEITEEIVGRFVQIPLKTAWAITIHKSQGLTFDRAIINAGRAFSYGQVYVALSRCRTLEGMVLSTPITPDIVTTDPAVASYNRLMEQNRPTAEQLIIDRRNYVGDILCDMFNFSPLQMRLNYVVRLADEHLSRPYPKYVLRCKTMQAETEAVLTEVGRIFQLQIRQLLPLADNYDDNLQLQERVQKATNYFLTKTAEVMQEFFDAGLPEIDNKVHREQLEREYELLKGDYTLKMQLFIKSTRGFSLNTYWDAKAVASMGIDEAGNAKKSKKESRKSAKEKTPKKIDLSVYGEDIQNPQLFERLRQWRNEKAAMLGVPAYTVMHNAALIALSNIRPTNPQMLLSVPGIGKKLVSAFGKELLEIVSAK